MGSGSSKSKQQKSPHKKPVANVNNDLRTAPKEIHKTTSRDITRHDEAFSEKKQQQIDFEKKQNEKNKNEKSNKKKVKDESPSYIGRHDSGLVFEDESDIDNDIDEVLKMPMAIEYNEPSKKSKSKKDQRGRDNKQESNLNNNAERDSSVGRRDENLPETYAQRLQRQQYKLQQNMLIRQKTLYRNPDEWDDNYEEEEDIQPRGFDASRFREANQRMVMDGKKELFTTNDNDELMTPRYMQSGQNLDDFQVRQRAESPDRKIPSYNQSELDLMAEIERDLL